MSVQLLATFLLFSVCVHYAVSDILYAQTTTASDDICIEYDCNEQGKGQRACERRATNADGNRYAETINLKKTKGKSNTFAISDSNGEPIGTLEEKYNSGVTKFIIKDLAGNNFRSGCLTKTKKPTEEDNTVIKELCNEKDTRVLDYKECD